MRSGQRLVRPCGCTLLPLLPLLVVAVLASCGSGSGSSDSGRGPTTSAPTEAAAATDAAPTTDAPLDANAQIDMIVAAGPTPKDGALAAFAAVMGPVPGHEDPPPVVPLDDEIVLGDRVIRLVLDHVEELSDDELAAVRAVVEGRNPAAGPRGRAAQVSTRASADVVRLQTLADEFTDSLGAAFGHRLTTGVTVRSVQSTIGAGWAATTPTRQLLNRDADGSAVVGPTCLIQVGPRLADADDGTLRSAMAHEAFHCLQDEVFGDSRLTPDWFHEGAASWVGLVYGADVPVFGTWWRTYLRANDWSLAASSYDAVGMFSTLQSAGVDIRAFMQSAFARADPSPGALLSTLDGLVGDTAVAQLGPSPARRGAWGPRWVAAGAGLGGTDARREPTTTAVGRSATIAPAVDGNIVQRVDLERRGVVVEIEGTAFGAWRWGESGEDLTGPVSRRYCGSEPCLCPDRTPVPGGPYAAMPDGELIVGLATLVSRVSTLTFTVTPIEELCEPRPSAPTSPPAGMYARLDGPGGGIWTPSDGVAYCTADQSGNAWILSIGPASGRSVSIAVARPPTSPGPQPDINIFWSDGATTYMNAPGTEVSFDDDLASGTFTGTALDPTGPNGQNAPISGAFDCGDGGTPPGGASPWTGR